MKEGLTSEEFQTVEELLIKANDEQLKFIEDSTIREQNKRNKRVEE